MKPKESEVTDYKDLVKRLRGLSAYDHSDFSVGDEAADAIEALSAQQAATESERPADAPQPVEVPMAHRLISSGPNAGRVRPEFAATPSRTDAALAAQPSPAEGKT